MLGSILSANQPRGRVKEQSKDESAAPIGGSIAGRILLPNGEEMSCSALMQSPVQAEIRAHGRANVGDMVVCALDNIGVLVGRITATTPAAFKIKFIFKGNHSLKVAARLEWHVTESTRNAQLRGAPRIVPHHRAVEVRLGEDIVLRGTIQDISISGAAISLNGARPPFVGARVRVGDRFATVIRLSDTGIAVQFVEPLAAHNFDERVLL